MPSDISLRHNVGTMPADRSPRQPAETAGWFDSPLAQHLITQEQREVLPLLTAHIGLRGLYLRPSPLVPGVLSGNMLQTVASVHRSADGGFDGDVRFADAELPFGSDTLSLVYALHVLESSPAPQALIGELVRAMKPEGVLFLVGLAPASAWRLRWRGRVGHADGPGHRRRLLENSGLSVELQLGLGPVWPAVGKSGRRALGSAQSQSPLDPLRAAFVLVARKRRAGITAIGRRARTVGLRASLGTG